MGGESEAQEERITSPCFVQGSFTSHLPHQREGEGERARTITFLPELRGPVLAIDTAPVSIIQRVELHVKREPRKEQRPLHLAGGVSLTMHMETVGA